MKAVKKETLKSRQKQQLLFGIAGALFALILLYQVFKSPTPEPVNKVSANPHPERLKDADHRNQPQPIEQPGELKVEDTQQVALNLDQLNTKAEGDASVDRNLFAYPPPPPPPPPDPPRPVTVPITAISPSSVYARTKELKLVVRGNNFAPEMRIYLNGSPTFAQTVFTSANELRADVPQQYFATAQQLRVEVKTPGQEEKFFSNPLTLTILEPPLPKFTMLGQMAESGGKNPTAILLDGDKRLVAPIGDNVSGTWKGINIGSNFVEVEEVTTPQGVRHPIKMKEPSDKSNGPA